MTLQKALTIAKAHGYERCTNQAHGLGTMITYNGRTAEAKFAICPIVQFYPKPTYLFHSEEDFVLSVKERHTL